LSEFRALFAIASDCIGVHDLWAFTDHVVWGDSRVGQCPLVGTTRKENHAAFLVWMVRSVVSPLRIAYDLLRVCPTFMNFFCSFVSIHALVAGFGGVSHDHFRRSLLLQHPTFFRLGRPVVLFFCGSEAWVATGICLGHHLHPVYPRLDLCSQPISATKGNRQVVRLPFSASASNSKAMICSLLLRISPRA
jgi:hypothetical protein